MCVIIVKPAYAAMPQIETLRSAAAHNPHGFGFCTPKRIYKTLSFEKFIKKLRKIKVNEPCILHFRYATKGSVKYENCHPFKEKNIFFAHNGSLRIETKNDMTDSETFFKNDVMPAIKKYGYGSEKLYNFITERADFSKFALMKGKDISLYGKFVELDGCYYSNLRWQNW